MTYECTIKIPVGLDTVWKEYDHPENMYTWQADLKSYYEVEDKEYDAVRIYEVAGEQIEFHQKNILKSKPRAEILLLNGNETRHIKDEFKSDENATHWKRVVKVTNKNILENIKLYLQKESYRSHTLVHMEGFKEKLSL